MEMQLCSNASESSLSDFLKYLYDMWVKLDADAE